MGRIPTGDNRTVDVYVVRGKRPGPRAVVTGGIHGDEYEGPVAVRSLTQTIVPDRVIGEVALAPVANPTALSAGTRTNPEDGKNLARTFPGNARGSPTDRLAAALWSALSAGTQFLIDLHSGGSEYDFLPMAGFYGPANEGNSSFAVAVQFGLPTLWQLPPTRGVLSYEFARAGGVALGCEYRGAGRLDRDGPAAYAEGVTRCLQVWGIVTGSRDDPPRPRPPAFASEWLSADADGLFETSRTVGERLRKGDELACIFDMRGRGLQRITAPRDGIILALRSKTSIRAGERTVLFGMPAAETA